MPPPAVLEIASQMAVALVHLEQAGLPHGDVSAATLCPDCPRAGGSSRRRACGQSFAPRASPTPNSPRRLRHADAPSGSMPAPPTRGPTSTPAAALWWHLLAGRALLSGRRCLGKTQRPHLSSAPAAIRGLAPDTPPILAEAIESCLQRDRRGRPASADALVRRLGSSTHSGGAHWLGACRMADARRRSAVPSAKPRMTRPSPWPIAAGLAALGRLCRRALGDRASGRGPSGSPSGEAPRDRTVTSRSQAITFRTRKNRERCFGRSGYSRRPTGKLSCPRPARQPWIQHELAADAAFIAPSATGRRF